MRILRHLSLGLALAVGLAHAPPASAVSGYYGASCAGCHGSTPTTCNGCHQHGGYNVSGGINKTSFAPGETVSFTVSAGTRTGWWRAAILDQSNAVKATTSVATGTSTTVTVPAPTAAGTYAWKVAWYGNERGGNGGATWVADPTNPSHGYRTAAVPAFTVAAPAAATVALSPASLAFGNVNVGASGSAVAQVRNTGTGPLSITGIARCANPATSAEFTWSPTALPITVAAGGTANLTVTYAPTAAGTDTGCLALTSNASNGPTTNLSVTGTGVVPAAPRIAVAPTSLAFGSVTVGTPSSRTFTISNTGTAPLTGTVARASGTSTEYGVSPASFNVAAGSSQVVTVTYAPTDTTSDAGSVTVTSNDAASPSLSVALSGAGVAAPAPNVALSPAALSFGTVTVGGSASLTAQVQNTGTAPLAVSQIARCATPATSAEFTWSPAGPFTVAAGGSTTVTVTYAPAGAGADGGCIAFSTNDAAHPVVSLDVSGTGQAAAAPRVAVSPTSLGFGNVTLGTSSEKTFTVSNTGNATLTGTVARAAGTSTEYTVSPATFSVAAGSSQVVTVTYAPADVASDAGSVVVSSNDAASPSVSVGLSGAGVAAATPGIALAPVSLSFGDVVLGQAATLAAQVRNTGAATLNVTSLARCAGTSTSFDFTPAAPFSVAPGQSATVSVTYRPTVAGSESGCLAVTSNDPASATVNLGLSGSGIAQAVPALALAPSALSFGSVAVGSAASQEVQVRNTGTGSLAVSRISLCSGTPSTFSWSPAAPLTVAAGESATVTVTFEPTAVGPSEGCLAVESNDAAIPTANLAVTGAGTQPPVPSVDVDVDVDELSVPERLTGIAGSSIAPRLELANRSLVEGTVTVTVTATVKGKKVYDETLPVTISAGGAQGVTFPAYVVTNDARGPIQWVATVADQDPDVDQATARTRLAWGGKSDDRAGASSDGAALVLGAGADASGSGAAGGCGSGGAGTTGLASLLALGLLASLRRTAHAARR
jgi:hypothetical protein